MLLNAGWVKWESVLWVVLLSGLVCIPDVLALWH